MKKIVISGLFMFVMFITAPIFPKTINIDGQASDKNAEMTEFGAKNILSEGQKINNFIFHVILRIAAAIAGGYGLLMAFFSGSIRPVVTYGGIAVLCLIMPYFIEGIFTGSSMVLR